jgi:hypothetical protein
MSDRTPAPPVELYDWVVPINVIDRDWEANLYLTGHATTAEARAAARKLADELSIALGSRRGVIVGEPVAIGVD